MSQDSQALPSFGRSTRVAAQQILGSSLVSRAWQPLRRHRIPIFTFHRFAVPDLRIPGHDVEPMRGELEQLRREGYSFVDLDQVFDSIDSGVPLPRRSICFTVDDGYLDYALVAADVFAAYDVPATVFLTTGFVDGTSWQWWDKIGFILSRAAPGRIRVELDGRAVEVELSTPDQRRAEAARLGLRCTAVGEEIKLEFLHALSLATGVDLPTDAPTQFAPMSWDDVRAAERRGTRFGPHSVTHPVLPHTSPEQAELEIATSWARVREEVVRPTAVFCHPNGDYGDREIMLCAAAGLRGATCTVPRYAHIPSAAADRSIRFALPRFPYPDDTRSLRLTTSGFNRISTRLRQMGIDR